MSSNGCTTTTKKDQTLSNLVVQNTAVLCKSTVTDLEVGQSIQYRGGVPGDVLTNVGNGYVEWGPGGPQGPQGIQGTGPQGFQGARGNQGVKGSSSMITKAGITNDIAFPITGIINKAIQFDTTIIDDYNMVGPGTSFTIPTSGWWRITYLICFEISVIPGPLLPGGNFGVFASKDSSVFSMKTFTDIGSVDNAFATATARSVTTSDITFASAGQLVDIVFTWLPATSNASAGFLQGVVPGVTEPLSYVIFELVREVPPPKAKNEKPTNLSCVC